MVFLSTFHVRCSQPLLPHLLDILLQKLPRHTSLCDLSGDTCLRGLLHEPQAADGALPIADILSLDLDQRHPRVFRSTSMHPIAKIAKPGIRAPTVKLFDPRIGAAGRGNGAADADPVLRAAVLECDLCRLVVLDISELFAVSIGQEEEVWADTLGNHHRARDGADAGTNCGKKADLETVNSLVEFINLLSFGGLIIPLLGN